MARCELLSFHVRPSRRPGVGRRSRLGRTSFLWGTAEAQFISSRCRAGQRGTNQPLLPRGRLRALPTLLSLGPSSCLRPQCPDLRRKTFPFRLTRDPNRWTECGRPAGRTRTRAQRLPPRRAEAVGEGGVHPGGHGSWRGGGKGRGMQISNGSCTGTREQARGYSTSG